MGATYVVIAPEHKLLDQLVKDKYKKIVDEYKNKAKHKSEVERSINEKEKTGIFTGTYLEHPLTKKTLPLWIADYVTIGYGTGVVMAVPAHDSRDYAFAKKYSLPIKQVVAHSNNKLPITKYGTLINSGDFNNMSSEDGKVAITNELIKLNLGNFKKTYRLHDWLISRQRYWGAPIPIVYCKKCGIVPVDENDLPVKLPYDVLFEPTGVSPLVNNKEFLNVKCPRCKGQARRETDTMDTFVCSSWYYLRYPDANDNSMPFNKDKINSILPVDKYVGGIAHATMHLLYARFTTKALRDMGFLDFSEPFKSLVHQGDILGSDGKAMSKSRPQYAIAPDEYINEYGSDVLRLYLAFGFSYIEGGTWSEEGFKSLAKFVARIERLIERYISLDEKEHKENNKLNYVLAHSIKSITEYLDRFQFNTSVARIMELLNALEKIVVDNKYNKKQLRYSVETFVLLLAPFAPHVSEELWEQLGHTDSVFNESWAKYNKKDLIKDIYELPIQINGKLKAKVSVNITCEINDIREKIMADNKIKSLVGDKKIKKIIVIPNKIANIIKYLKS